MFPFHRVALRLFLCALLFPLIAVRYAAAAPLSSEFTYQGQLEKSGAPANGSCDLQFSLFDLASGGSAIAGPLARNAVLVDEGVFNVLLDFGVDVFNGDARWLGISVRCPAGAGAFALLTPRQPLTATPYALQTRGIYVNSAGKVGIGTRTPLGRLEVADTQALVRLNSSGVSGSVLNLFNSNPDPSTIGQLDFGHTSGTLGRIMYSWGGMDFGSPANTALRITPTGDVGIGTLSPATRLDVNAVSQTAIRGMSTGIGVLGSHTGGTGTFPGVWGETSSTSNGASAVRAYATAASGSAFGLDGRSSSPGGVGVNAQNDAGGTALRAVGNGSFREQATVRIENTQPNSGMAAYIKSQGTWAAMHLENSGTGEVLWLENTGQGPYIVANDRASGTWKFWVDKNGVANVRVLQIHGGADLAEHFEVQAAAGSGAGVERAPDPEPGMIVSIDPENPGKLVVSSRAYDPTVAGVVSGAGGIQSGMLMGQEGSLADGSVPVALSGRVYCRGDAGSSPIRPGDLLTTSDRPGHAMKVEDPQRAAGAIIGKAMTPLDEGTGLVLVLVSLQ